MCKLIYWDRIIPSLVSSHQGSYPPVWCQSERYHVWSEYIEIRFLVLYTLVWSGIIVVSPINKLVSFIRINIEKYARK